MGKVNLTQAVVARLEAPADGRKVVRDAKAPGLILVVTPSGTKSYYLYRRVRGRPSRILLGHHPLLTVEAARDQAVKRYASIIDGADPNAEKRAHRRGGLTLQEAFDHFLANRLDARASPKTRVSHKSRFDTCLAGWGNRRLDGIRREEVVALHVRLGKGRGHTTANRAVQLLRALFNYAADKLGADLANPAARVELYRETPRERFLRADELPRFFRAVEAEPDKSMRDFFLLALF
ncbi:MAG TPA: Arm DNA-binding domain-containing protein, partial [Gemmataceae bacterium]|nr:Arm DNA-binding domain-containing protein [Gemmataceae bacterium]